MAEEQVDDQERRSKRTVAVSLTMVISFIDDDGWNPDPRSLQDSHGPLYIDRTHKDFVARLLFRLDRLNLDTLGLSDEDLLVLEESIMLCRSAAEEWVRDPRSEAKISGRSGRACDNPVVVIRRLLERSLTLHEKEQEGEGVSTADSSSRGRARRSTDEILAEIAEGESETLEFKSSLRWNVREGRKDRSITDAAVEAIQGFQNARGGVLYIGVDNDGARVGIEHDGFESGDAFLLCLKDAVKSRLGQAAATRISLRLYDVDGTAICRVECEQSSAPVHMHRGQGRKEKFCVRAGPSTETLAGSEMIEFIRERFHPEKGPPLVPIPVPLSLRSRGPRASGPGLSREARTLLVEAVSDPQGTILRSPAGLGDSTTTFQANGKTFGEHGNRRSEALWEVGLEQLEHLDLVRGRGYAREVFLVTKAGYELADKLSS